ncbi:MAG: aldose 1-epimerase [Bacteroidetes bacterium]|nr:aldose 1-epimerase [Bacteroidota bacterium]
MMIKKYPFAINEKESSNFSEVVIKNNCTNEFLTILPDFGARLKELWLSNGKENISVLKRVRCIDSNNRDDIFTNAKLSPFAGRIKDGQYLFNNINYNLQLNYQEEGNACHGFIYNKKFQMINKEVNDEYAYCKLRYEYDNEDDGYPFTYSIDLTYRLSANDGLTCTTKIVNHSKSVIPISDGWHYYFDLGMDVNELKLQLDVSKIIELDTRLIPTGTKTVFDEFNCPEILGTRHFDSCFEVNGNNGKATTRLISERRNIDLHLWQETGSSKYDYIVVYTPPDRKSIAIEPMTSNVNSFNNGEGLIVLQPNEEYNSSFGIRLSKIID